MNLYLTCNVRLSAPFEYICSYTIDKTNVLKTIFALLFLFWSWLLKVYNWRYSWNLILDSLYHCILFIWERKIDIFNNYVSTFLMEQLSSDLSQWSYISQSMLYSLRHLMIYTYLVPRLASAVTWPRGPRPWCGFTHRPLTTTKCPLRVRVRPDHEHGKGMGRVDMERGPGSI